MPEIHAYFAVASDSATLDELNARLGVRADTGWSVGDTSSQTGRKHSFTFWQVNPLESVVGLEAQLASLLERTLPAIPGIRAISDEDLSPRLEVVPTFAEEDLGIHSLVLDAAWIAALDSVSGALDIDQYLDTDVDDPDEDDWGAGFYEPSADRRMVGATMTVELSGLPGTASTIVTTDPGVELDYQEPLLRLALEELPPGGTPEGLRVVLHQRMELSYRTETGLGLSPETIHALAAVGGGLVIETEIVTKPVSPAQPALGQTKMPKTR